MALKNLDAKVRLYGRFWGQHSHAQVASGFCEAFFGAHRYDLEYWGNALDESTSPETGADAEYGIFLGPLNLLPVMKARGEHRKTFVMVAPNSTEIGKPIVDLLVEYAEHVLVPSGWARQVMLRLLEGTGIGVSVVPHGVSHHYLDGELPPMRRLPWFSVLHLSSSVLPRKGTFDLVRAWKLADLPGQLFLSIPAPQIYDTVEMLEDLHLLAAKNVQVTQRLDMTPQELARLYSQMHYICQPSRGEGFGLVPLEARCCGTPVIATTCTGHSQHMHGPGIVPVPTGDLEPIQDVQGSLAPSLSVDDLAASLVRAYEQRVQKSEEAREHASVLRATWSWSKQLEEFRNELGSS
jgi:glycosyltransferase involved in cell wall biosynthesis